MVTQLCIMVDDYNRNIPICMHNQFNGSIRAKSYTTLNGPDINHCCSVMPAVDYPNSLPVSDSFISVIWILLDKNKVQILKHFGQKFFSSFKNCNNSTAEQSLMSAQKPPSMAWLSWHWIIFCFVFVKCKMETFSKWEYSNN